MCSAPTRHVAKVRLSIHSPYRVVIPRITPEYQYPWFRFIALPFSSMLDAAVSDMAGAAGSLSLSSSLLATDLAAITVASGLSETTTCSPSSIDVNVPATAVTMAADVAKDTHHNFAANVDGGPPPVYVGWDANQRAWHNNGLADTQPPSGPHDHEVATGRDPCGRYGVASWRTCTSGTGSTGSTGLRRRGAHLKYTL